MARLLSYILLSGILLFHSTFTFSQERVIHGKVTTLNEIALVGAKITVKSTKQVILTDTLGLFSVPCMKKDKLKVSANGFITENIKIGEKHKIVLVNLKFRSDPDSREIAIGYGHVRESDNLMPVSSMEKKDQDFSQFSDIYEVVNVRFPEVQIVNGDIIIRGARSLEGNDAALLVVDGMVVDKSIFGSTHVSHIARIDILKGAAATAYGARGANGVVLVETKTGPNQ